MLQLLLRPQVLKSCQLSLECRIQSALQIVVEGVDVDAVAAAAAVEEYRLAVVQQKAVVVVVHTLAVAEACKLVVVAVVVAVVGNSSYPFVHWDHYTWELHSLQMD